MLAALNETDKSYPFSQQSPDTFTAGRSHLLAVLLIVTKAYLVYHIVRVTMRRSSDRQVKSEGNNASYC